jgi:threonine/homoserine/homoserine lactone efflux protein
MQQVCQDCQVDVFITGLVAGIALAIPLGPMAILLISTTIQYGRSIGVFGALAMASVDFSYAALVFAFGNAVIGALSDWIFPMRIAGSAILAFVALRIFLEARKSSRLESPELGNAATTRAKTYAKFFGLTVLNPATAFYFVGITPSVAAMAESSSVNVGVLAFALGVFFGSVVWQLSLVFAAHLTAKFTDLKVQHRIQYAGAFLIVALALGLLLQ